jgi:hypothetical protein
MKTHWKKTFNPDYFGSWSIPEGEDLIVTIDKVNVQEVAGEGGRTEQLPVCHFIEDFKPLVLNATNSRQITSLHGSPYIEDWHGKKIQLFQSTTKMKGEEVECVRVRPMIPTEKKKAFTPKNPRWKGAVESIAKGESTVEAIKKFFSLSEANEAKLKEEVMLKFEELENA